MNTLETDAKLEALLEYLQRSREFDFSGYKRASLMRRINRRMETVGLEGYDNYMDYLEVHPEEFAQLFNTILINVTDFFRDQPAWDFLAQDVIPKILNGKGPNDSIRIWCAGVASGEEAYSLAMLFANALGREAFLSRVKVYATDVDEESLNQARLASYAEDRIENVPEQWREQFFERANSRYVFRADLRRSVIFGRHDLIQDAPISRLDLLVCRNTLMYFNLETQTRILNRFHFALADDGFLFLGRAEMLLTHTDLFAPIDLRYRIFTKVSRPEATEWARLFVRNDDAGLGERLSQYVRLREAAFDASQDATFVVDLNGLLVLANEQARAIFGIKVSDVGRRFHELEVSYLPAELRSRIDRAHADRQHISVPNVEYTTLDGRVMFLDIEVVPLEEDDAVIGVIITMEDVTRRRLLEEDVQRAKQDLETAYEELQSANEELETTNEELQSTVEELQTTNEELQSTNEELETMNEELQSTNEELETTNTELRSRSEDVDMSNAFLSSVLQSLRAAVIVVDRDFRVVQWNRKAEDLWGLRENEVNARSFFNLDIGLPVGKLGEPMRASLSDGNPEPTTLEATNRRGKPVRCRVTYSPLKGARGERRGVILMIEAAD